ncbi:MAG TPA: hypothetical protein VJ874_01290 [Candidatus Thermoplasmatota archaeon]|nr:hypothetical protein [Candidatus Thermoplasmatota archaeon]
MRLADRLFAFRRLPAWSDAVQVLLWLMGLILIGLFVALMAYLGPGWIRDFRSLSGEPWSAALIPVIIIILTLGWFVVGSWFLSEAYGGWRVGHPHGKGWAIVIGVLLIMNGAGPLFIGVEVEGLQHAGYSLGAAFGVALLVAVFTTKPPHRKRALAA